MSTYYTVQSDTSTSLALQLKGHWTAAALPAIKKDLQGKVSFKGLKHISFDGKELEDFDTSAAWYLNEIASDLKEDGVKVDLRGFMEGYKLIFDRVAHLPRAGEPQRPEENNVRIFFSGVGAQMVYIWRDFLRATAYLGQFLVNFAEKIMTPRRLRLRSVVFHINEVGIKAVPIIALMAFSIAFVMGYQGAFQLQKFDATVYTVDLVVLSILREMGVLITSIMVAGRSGSAFAAQLGTMKLNEEVDALKTMGVAPFEVLVLPRLLAIIIALPLLTVLADVAGILGGYVFSYSYLDYSYIKFLARMQEAADMRQFYVGISKAPVFAILIGIVGCMQGLMAHSSAEDVGRKTITAVVQSIFLVIVADALFSVVFTRLGI